MTHDEAGAVLENLIQTLEDGRMGFADAAEKLQGSGHADLAGRMTEFGAERARFSDELRMAAKSIGHEVSEAGSGAGALHRGWMALKDALTGDDAKPVLSAAESGEDHAVEQYQEALAADLPSHLHDVIAKQAMKVQAAHDAVRAMRDQT